MRTIDLSNAFKRDYKRVKANPRYQQVRELYEAVSLLLAEDKPMPDNYQDHPLVGDWKGYRECHLRPDLLLIYRKEDPDILRIARLGSHPEIFG
jgi:mRNA interferase YafQ